MNIPQLKFTQLAKIFAAGLIGYLTLVTMLSIAGVLFFPKSMKSFFDMSMDQMLPGLPIVFGIVGAIMALIFLFGSWCIMRLFPQKKPNQSPEPTSLRAVAHL